MRSASLRLLGQVLVPTTPAPCLRLLCQAGTGEALPCVFLCFVNYDEPTVIRQNVFSRLGALMVMNCAARLVQVVPALSHRSGQIGSWFC
jgi:hypothetical protein